MRISQELVHMPENSAFQVRIFEDVKLDYPVHQHRKSYELTFTVGLSGTRIVGDSINEFSHLDLVLMSPGLPHCWYDHDIRRPSSDQKVVVVHFFDWLISEEQMGSVYFDSIKRALQLSVLGLELTGDSLRKAVDLMNAIPEGNSFESFQIVLSVLDLFGNDVDVKKLSSEGYNIVPVSERESRIEKAYQYIQEHYSTKFNMDDVADHLHMSPSAFSHFFKKHSLKSFTEFVLDLRLGRSARMLQFTDEPVASIAYQSGFQNISNFHRSFLRKFNCTPLQFKKKYLRG